MNLQIKVLVKKNGFLCNVNNKKSFIKLLRKRSEDHGIKTYQSYGDTDHCTKSFPLRIALVNVTKSAVSCRFGHICGRNP